ncbi:uncharacterized protein TRIVIDRAFT_216117 [Trichoderma virens Gv29-8]|uniref:Uncharacterized protein n=1 Tax=Hypocrea virens (strain Gv29-8 / FGSC 10586) TaxID=413071 RepID=G9MRZ4_HYPVG|nr:uncharacterized protein TRIVIDRAFT_216117 [Trichoderma virens Gv29-8]EHK22862.1 hypothetical protein TRIVIDRAFT_216117 [Trichoderma virens Gv29-8]
MFGQYPTIENRSRSLKEPSPGRGALPAYPVLSHLPSVHKSSTSRRISLSETVYYHLF